VRGDGDGWVRCTQGHAHWGLYGAAGLMVVSGGRVLLQHRAFWSHHGNTWGIPGGARGRAESAVEAALREAAEETGLVAAEVEVVKEFEDDHGGWSYTTVLASATSLLPVEPLDGESAALEWIPLAEVEGLPLHPGFALGWPEHLERLREG
jgi:8-oxo-dGTP diphosphatase